MPKRPEDVLSKIWDQLKKEKLDELQIYRVWQMIVGSLAREGWLRKRAGKGFSMKTPRRNTHEELDEARILCENAKFSFGAAFSVVPFDDDDDEKKDHISTSQLLQDEAESLSKKPRSDSSESIHAKRKKRQGQW